MRRTWFCVQLFQNVSNELRFFVHPLKFRLASRQQTQFESLRKIFKDKIKQSPFLHFHEYVLSVLSHLMNNFSLLSLQRFFFLMVEKHFHCEDSLQIIASFLLVYLKFFSGRIFFVYSWRYQIHRRESVIFDRIHHVLLIDRSVRWWFSIVIFSSLIENCLFIQRQEKKRQKSLLI